MPGQPGDNMTGSFGTWLVTPRLVVKKVYSHPVNRNVTNLGPISTDSFNPVDQVADKDRLTFRMLVDPPRTRSTLPFGRYWPLLRYLPYAGALRRRIGRSSQGPAHFLEDRYRLKPVAAVDALLCTHFQYDVADEPAVAQSPPHFTNRDAQGRLSLPGVGSGE